MTPQEIDEWLLWDLPRILASGDRWQRAFAASIRRQAQNKAWRPSPKQVRVMRDLAARHNADDGDLVE